MNPTDNAAPTPGVPFNAPPGSTPGVEAGAARTSLNRSPADPSQPQIPPNAADAAGLPNADHPLAPPAKTALEAHADLGGKIDRLRDQVGEWFKGFENETGSAAADVKGKLAELHTFLAEHKQRYFPPR